MHDRIANMYTSWIMWLWIEMLQKYSETCQLGHTHKPVYGIKYLHDHFFCFFSFSISECKLIMQNFEIRKHNYILIALKLTSETKITKYKLPPLTITSTNWVHFHLDYSLVKKLNCIINWTHFIPCRSFLFMNEPLDVVHNWPRVTAFVFHWSH